MCGFCQRWSIMQLKGVKQSHAGRACRSSRNLNLSLRTELSRHKPTAYGHCAHYSGRTDRMPQTRSGSKTPWRQKRATKRGVVGWGGLSARAFDCDDVINTARVSVNRRSQATTSVPSRGGMLMECMWPTGIQIAVPRSVQVLSSAFG